MAKAQLIIDIISVEKIIRDLDECSFLLECTLDHTFKDLDKALNLNNINKEGE